MILLLALLFTAVSCEKIEPELFDEDANGAYFDYSSAAEFEQTINFGNLIIGNPEEASLVLKVKLLGYLTDKERTLSIKSKPVEGYELADITIPEVTFKNREYMKDVEIMVKRPAVEDKVYAISVYLDGEGDLGTGISGKNEFTLYVKETYEMPAVWRGMVDMYLGLWNREKHFFLANLTGENSYYDALYNYSLGQHKYEAIIGMNELVVNTLLAEEPAEPIVVDFPILGEDSNPKYEKPYFWEKYEQYLGIYKVSKFCKFNKILGGASTKNIIALYAGETAATKMTEYKDKFHKEDVLDMLNEYYNYPKLGYPISEYKSHFWVEMSNKTNYQVRIPYWWEDPDDLGTAEVVNRYFGEYDDTKYQFMLKSVMKKVGSANFVAAEILPFTISNDGNGYGWDESVGGEEKLKECYRIIKAEFDSAPSGIYKFEIPEVNLE